MNKILILFLLLMISRSSFGEQVFKVLDGDTVRIKVSIRDLTRIKIQDGRVSKVLGVENSLKIEPDKQKGELFLKTLTTTPKSFSFFVKDGEGRTYTVLAELFDYPSQTVTLIPVYSKKAEDSAELKSESFMKRIKEMIRYLAVEKKGVDYKEELTNEKVPFWKECQLRHVRKLISGRLVGHTYLIKNTSDTKMTLDENEFLGLRSDVVAVSVENTVLEKDQETKIYVLTF